VGCVDGDLRRRGQVTIARSLYLVDGAVMLRKRIVGHDTRVVVTHDAALRSVVEVCRGRLVIALPAGEVVAPPRFVLAMPPRSVVAMRFEHAEVIADGLGAMRALDDHDRPAIEDVAPAASAYRAVMARGALVARLDPDAGVALALVRARRALHDAIADPAPVRIAAAAAGLAAETLARRFADAYQISPKQYCQRARLFDAAMLLFDGASVLDAALRAGFNDLTRFYVQFRRLLGGTPGQYAQIRKRQELVARAR